MKIKPGEPRVILRDVLRPFLGMQKMTRAMVRSFKCRVKERDPELFPDFGSGPVLPKYVYLKNKSFLVIECLEAQKRLRNFVISF
jgi:hypothetical protein